MCSTRLARLLLIRLTRIFDDDAKIVSRCFASAVRGGASTGWASAFNEGDRGACFLAGITSGLRFFRIPCCWLLPIMFFLMYEMYEGMLNSSTIEEKQQEDMFYCICCGGARSNLISPAKPTGCSTRWSIALTCIVQYNVSLSQNHDFLVAGCHFLLLGRPQWQFGRRRGQRTLHQVMSERCDSKIASMRFSSQPWASCMRQTRHEFMR